MAENAAYYAHQNFKSMLSNGKRNKYTNIIDIRHKFNVPRLSTARILHKELIVTDDMQKIETLH